jgi:hypothetical protein
MKTSPFLSLNWEDFGKGLIVAVLSAVLIKLADMIGLGFGNINWNELLSIAATTGIAYLVKNMFTNSDGQMLQGEK